MKHPHLKKLSKGYGLPLVVAISAVAAAGGCSANSASSTPIEKRQGFSKISIEVSPTSQSKVTEQFGLSGDEPVFLGLGIFQEGRELSTLALRPGLTEVVVPNGPVEFRASYVMYRTSDNSQVFYSKALTKETIQRDGQEIVLNFEDFQAVKLRRVYGVAYLNDNTPAANAVIQVKDPWSGATVSLPDGSELARTDNRGVFAFPFFYGATGVSQDVQLSFVAGNNKKLVKFPLPAKGNEEFTPLPFINLTGTLQKSPLALNMGLLRGEKGDKGDRGETGASAGIELMPLSPGASGCADGGMRVITWKQPPGTSSAKYDPTTGSFDRAEIVYCDVKNNPDDVAGGGGGMSPGDQNMGPEIVNETDVLLGRASSGGWFGFHLDTDKSAFFPLTGTGTAGQYDVDAELTFFEDENCAGPALLGNRRNVVGARPTGYVKLDQANAAANSGIQKSFQSYASRQGTNYMCQPMSSQVAAIASAGPTIFAQFTFDSWNQLPQSNNGERLQTIKSFMKSTDGGMNFSAVPLNGLPSNVTIANIAALSQDHVWIRTQMGATYFSSNGGSSWTTQTPSGISADLLFGAQDIRTNGGSYFIFDRGNVFYSTNGTVWQSPNLSSFSSMLNPYPQISFAEVAGSRDLVLIGQNMNQSKTWLWSSTDGTLAEAGYQSSGSRPPMGRYSFAVPTTVGGTSFKIFTFSNESNGSLWQSENGGNIWNPINPPGGKSLPFGARVIGYQCTGPTLCLAAAESGGLVSIYSTDPNTFGSSGWLLKKALALADAIPQSNYGNMGPDRMIVTSGTVQIYVGGRVYLLNSTYNSITINKSVDAMGYPTTPVTLPSGATFPLMNLMEKAN